MNDLLEYFSNCKKQEQLEKEVKAQLVLVKRAEKLLTDENNIMTGDTEAFVSDIYDSLYLKLLELQLELNEVDKKIIEFQIVCFCSE